MYHVLGRVPVADLRQFLAVFTTAGAELRRRHGARRSVVFHAPGEPAHAVVLVEWESAEAFARFRADPEAPATMRAGGALGPPEFTPLEWAGEYSA